MGWKGRRTDGSRVRLNGGEEIGEQTLYVGALCDDGGGDAQAAQGEDGEV
jgi:hypothetical protein